MTRGTNGKGEMRLRAREPQKLETSKIVCRVFQLVSTNRALSEAVVIVIIGTIRMKFVMRTLTFVLHRCEDGDAAC
jgi:hypothetical protein